MRVRAGGAETARSGPIGTRVGPTAPRATHRDGRAEALASGAGRPCATFDVGRALQQPPDPTSASLNDRAVHVSCRWPTSPGTLWVRNLPRAGKHHRKGLTPILPASEKVRKGSPDRRRSVDLSKVRTPAGCTSLDRGRSSRKWCWVRSPIVVGELHLLAPPAPGSGGANGVGQIVVAVRDRDHADQATDVFTRAPSDPGLTYPALVKRDRILVLVLAPTPPRANKRREV